MNCKPNSFAQCGLSVRLNCHKMKELWLIISLSPLSLSLTHTHEHTHTHTLSSRCACLQENIDFPHLLPATAARLVTNVFHLASIIDPSPPVWHDKSSIKTLMRTRWSEIICIERVNFNLFCDILIRLLDKQTVWNRIFGYLICIYVTLMQLLYNMQYNYSKKMVITKSIIKNTQL